MISNVVIVHGSMIEDKRKDKDYVPENVNHWFLWIKQKLEEKGIKTFVPLMPESWIPKYEDWKTELEKILINENSILIGHSSGGGFLIRWLGETERKVKKLILVAPAIIHSEGREPLEDLLKFKINKNVQKFVKEIVIFVSEDDMDRILKSVDIFSEALEVKPRVFKDKAHFSKGDMKTKEFPELLEEVLK